MVTEEFSQRFYFFSTLIHLKLETQREKSSFLNERFVIVFTFSLGTTRTEASSCCRLMLWFADWNQQPQPLAG